MKHCMLDLETFGTDAGCVLRSIGAVQFDPRGTKLGSTFYSNITEEDQIELGLVKDQSTIEWWSRQSAESQAQLLLEQRSLKEVATEFHQWFKGNKLTFVWAQGSNFDPVLWEHAVNLLDLKAPWRFYNTRDTRTAYQMAGFSTKSLPRQGTYHNALDDSIHQVRCIYKSHLLIDGVTKR